MHSAWFRSTFPRVLKFLQIKEGRSSFCGETTLQNALIIWFPHLCLNFKTFMDPNLSSSTRFQCILHDSWVLFSDSSNFYKLKRRDQISWAERILQNVLIIWSPLLYLNFKSFIDPNSLSFIAYQCMLHDLGVLFEEFSNLYKLKRGDLISGGEPILQIVWIICSPLLLSNFESFLDRNSSSFTRFQCILYDSGVLLSGFSNLYKLKRGDLISGGNQFCRMSELFGPPFCISILKVF